MAKLSEAEKQRRRERRLDDKLRRLHEMKVGTPARFPPPPHYVTRPYDQHFFMVEINHFLKAQGFNQVQVHGNEDRGWNLFNITNRWTIRNSVNDLWPIEDGPLGFTYAYTVRKKRPRFKRKSAESIIEIAKKLTLTPERIAEITADLGKRYEVEKAKMRKEIDNDESVTTHEYDSIKYALKELNKVIKP